MHLKVTALLLTLSFISLSCEPKENQISSIENDLLPVFYIEGEKPAPASLHERMEHYDVPGLSVAVYRKGKLEWAKGYGVADKESNKPVTDKTLFQAASISKPVTAMAVLDMAEDGDINIDTDINEYLSSWKLSENEFTTDEKVTLRRILNHTAGISVGGFPGYSRANEAPNAIEVVSGYGKTDSVYVYKTPGESWQYSGGGYTALQIVLSDVKGLPFEKIMADHVLTPLAMNSSTFEQPLPQPLHDIAATGYRGDGSEVEQKWHVYPEQAAAGLWTTPTDIGRYALSVQNALHGNKNEVLEPATVQEMLTPGDREHGLGPMMHLKGTYFGHGGANEGFRNHFVASMKGGNIVIIMTNSDNGVPLISELMQAIFRHYKWWELQPTVKTKVDLPADYLSLFTGRYYIPELGELTIALHESGLSLTGGEAIENEINLVPESDSVFFNASDGTPFRFNFRNEIPAGFDMQGFTATKVGK